MAFISRLKAEGFVIFDGFDALIVGAIAGFKAARRREAIGIYRFVVP